MKRLLPPYQYSSPTSTPFNRQYLLESKTQQYFPNIYMVLIIFCSHLIFSYLKQNHSPPPNKILITHSPQGRSLVQQIQQPPSSIVNQRRVQSTESKCQSKEKTPVKVPFKHNHNQNKIKLNEYIKQIDTQQSSMLNYQEQSKLFSKLKISPIHKQKESAFLSMDPQSNRKNKVESLSSSSCMTESQVLNITDRQQFQCEKAFEMMQMIDAQLNKNLMVLDSAEFGQAIPIVQSTPKNDFKNHKFSFSALHSENESDDPYNNNAHINHIVTRRTPLASEQESNLSLKYREQFQNKLVNKSLSSKGFKEEGINQYLDHLDINENTDDIEEFQFKDSNYNLAGFQGEQQLNNKYRYSNNEEENKCENQSVSKIEHEVDEDIVQTEENERPIQAYEMMVQQEDFMDKTQQFQEVEPFQVTRDGSLYEKQQCQDLQEEQESVQVEGQQQQLEQQQIQGEEYYQEQEAKQDEQQVNEEYQQEEEEQLDEYQEQNNQNYVINSEEKDFQILKQDQQSEIESYIQNQQEQFCEDIQDYEQQNSEFIQEVHQYPYQEINNIKEEQSPQLTQEDQIQLTSTYYKDDLELVNEENEEDEDRIIEQQSPSSIRILKESNLSYKPNLHIIPQYQKENQSYCSQQKLNTLSSQVSSFVNKQSQGINSSRNRNMGYFQYQITFITPLPQKPSNNRRKSKSKSRLKRSKPIKKNQNESDLLSLDSSQWQKVKIDPDLFNMINNYQDSIKQLDFNINITQG